MNGTSLSWWVQRRRDCAARATSVPLSVFRARVLSGLLPQHWAAHCTVQKLCSMCGRYRGDHCRKEEKPALANRKPEPGSSARYWRWWGISNTRINARREQTEVELRRCLLKHLRETIFLKMQKEAREEAVNIMEVVSDSRFDASEVRPQMKRSGDCTWILSANRDDSVRGEYSKRGFLKFGHALLISKALFYREMFSLFHDGRWGRVWSRNVLFNSEVAWQKTGRGFLVLCIP